MPTSTPRAVAFAPATMANLGVGFDILGLAVAEPGDTIEAVFSDEPGVHISDITGDGGRLPREAERNTAGIAAQSVLLLAGETRGVALNIHKGLPLASGLGSSAASAVAAAVAVNILIGEPLTRAELLPAALDGEAFVSGRHADNVAPCLLGGITLSFGLTASEIWSLPVPENLWLALVTPAVEVPTAQARAVLPEHVPLKTMVTQTASVARLMSALYRGDIPAMAAAMEADRVIEPARAHLMPKLHEVRRAAHLAGAYGLVISGAGPTLAAVCDDPETARVTAKAIERVYIEAGYGAVARACQVAVGGAYPIISQTADAGL
ncbi:MAG: homoserine kinase [Anaerolineae bacterium]